MKWTELSITESEEEFNRFFAFEDFYPSDEYKELHDDIAELFESVLGEIGINAKQIQEQNNAYKVDYLFGIRFYKLMTTKYKMSIRIASNAGVWRFLSIKVVPDIVSKRYAQSHPDRFWKKAKRIWLRVIWWYIYLSWQGDEKTTETVLKDNSTDEILQLVDRCGKGGYRLELYRAIMKKNSQIPIGERRKSEIFRKVMVLNTARVQVIEPSLVMGGEKEYVENLFKYFEE